MGYDMTVRCASPVERDALLTFMADHTLLWASAWPGIEVVPAEQLGCAPQSHGARLGFHVGVSTGAHFELMAWLAQRSTYRTPLGRAAMTYDAEAWEFRPAGSTRAPRVKGSVELLATGRADAPSHGWSALRHAMPAEALERLDEGYPERCAALDRLDEAWSTRSRPSVRTKSPALR